MLTRRSLLRYGGVAAGVALIPTSLLGEEGLFPFAQQNLAPLLDGVMIVFSDKIVRDVFGHRYTFKGHYADRKITLVKDVGTRREAHELSHAVMDVDYAHHPSLARARLDEAYAISLGEVLLHTAWRTGSVGIDADALRPLARAALLKRRSLHRDIPIYNFTDAEMQIADDALAGSLLFKERYLHASDRLRALAGDP